MTGKLITILRDCRPIVYYHSPDKDAQEQRAIFRDFSTQATGNGLWCRHLGIRWKRICKV